MHFHLRHTDESLDQASTFPLIWSPILSGQHNAPVCWPSAVYFINNKTVIYSFQRSYIGQINFRNWLSDYTRRDQVIRITLSHFHIMSTLLIISSTFQLSSNPIVLTRLSGPVRSYKDSYKIKRSTSEKLFVQVARMEVQKCAKVSNSGSGRKLFSLNLQLRSAENRYEYKMSINILLLLLLLLLFIIIIIIIIILRKKNNT